RPARNAAHLLARRLLQDGREALRPGTLIRTGRCRYWFSAGEIFMTIGYGFFALIVALAAHVLYAYNALVKKRKLVAEGLSGIDVQLRRRADLVPNLVETVKGYAAHEDRMFRDLSELRARSISGGSVNEQSSVGQAMSAALGRLFAIAEAYPELKADANFRDLQDKLAGIEDEIQLSRRYYNGAVRNLNTMIESFPSNLVANAFRFGKA